MLKDYEKSEKYYKNPRQDIYQKVKQFQKDAISNAGKLGSFNFDNPETAKAEIYKLFQLLGFVKG